MQRAHYSKRRKEIWEALHPEPSVDYGREDGGETETEVAQVAPPQFAGQLGGARPQTKGFAAATAEVTGESKAQINRNVARAEAIGDDLLRLTGTSQRIGRLCPPCKFFVELAHADWRKDYTARQWYPTRYPRNRQGQHPARGPQYATLVRKPVRNKLHQNATGWVLVQVVL